MGLVLNDTVFRSCTGSTIFTKTSPNIQKFLNGLNDGSSGVDVSSLTKYSDGSVFRVIEGLRTMKKQLELYLQGRNCNYRDLGWSVNTSLEKKPQYLKKNSVVVDKTKVITNAFAGQSAHNYGLAVDICIRSVGIPKSNLTLYKGEPVTLKELYAKIGLLAWAKKCGLEWGGDWSDLKDYSHFEDKSYFYPVKSDFKTQDGFDGNTFWKDSNANFMAIEKYNRDFSNKINSGKSFPVSIFPFAVLGIFFILKSWGWLKNETDTNFKSRQTFFHYR